MQLSSPLQKALSTNSTASYATVIPTITKPTAVTLGKVSSVGTYDLGVRVPCKIKAHFFGAGADNATMKSRLYGWSRIGTDPGLTLWVPTLIWDITATLSTTVGIANAKIIATDRFCDTLSVTYQPTGINTITTSGNTTNGKLEVFSAANQFIAWVIAPLYGFEMIQFDFDKDAATNANAAFSMLRE